MFVQSQPRGLKIICSKTSNETCLFCLLLLFLMVKRVFWDVHAWWNGCCPSRVTWLKWLPIQCREKHPVGKPWILWCLCGNRTPFWSFANNANSVWRSTTVLSRIGRNFLDRGRACDNGTDDNSSYLVRPLLTLESLFSASNGGIPGHHNL